MKRHLRIPLLLMAVALLLNPALMAAPLTDTDAFIRRVRHHLKNQLIQNGRHQNLVCQGELICGVKLMPKYYQEHRYTPIWFDENGLRPAARTLIKAIQAAHHDGLHPDDYHASIIQILVTDYDLWPQDLDDVQAAVWADIDLLLTDAFLLLGAHLSAGRVDPETLHADWVIPEKAIDVMAVLHHVGTSAQVEEIISNWRPSHGGYDGLRQAFLKMRQIQARGGWPRIPDGDILRPGNHDSRISLLRKRLEITRDLTDNQPVEGMNRYDDALADAVRHFQQRHGLKPDGMIGKGTLTALNVSADKRVRQIELNLERWRWLPRHLSDRYILVNTAAYYLQVVEKNRMVLHMRVVVGTPARRTPVFTSSITHMVLNPYWTVPPTIAVEDILPKVRKGADYLIQHGFKVYNGWNEHAEAIDPVTIDWEIYGKSFFPFRLRQDPGPQNALGRIKFMLPNKFDVYLHDTPQRSHFNQIERDFSSGCIRVENALALAVYLISKEPDKTAQDLQTGLSSGRRQVVRLANPIPVHLLYMTAWQDATGRIQFRKDIYDRDKDLHNALFKRQPVPLPPLVTSEGMGH